MQSAVSAIVATEPQTSTLVVTTIRRGASQGAVSVGYTLPARDAEHGFLFPEPGARDDRYPEATGASPARRDQAAGLLL